MICVSNADPNSRPGRRVFFCLIKSQLCHGFNNLAQLVSLVYYCPNESRGVPISRPLATQHYMLLQRNLTRMPQRATIRST